MPYFENYNYEDLREKFVKNRFSEEQWYGNSEIERWLERERNAQTSSINDLPEKTFERIEDRIEAMRMGAVLEQYASPVPRRKLPNILETEGNKAVARILPFLASNVDFYSEGDTLILVLNDKGKKRAWSFFGAHEMQEGLGPVAVHCVIRTEWNYHKRRWESARKFLCDLLAKDIAVARAQAEEEFDDAIAVSEDGTKIVPAPSRIVILSGHPRSIHGWWAYTDPAHIDFFKKHKIRRSERMLRATIDPYGCGWDSETQSYDSNTFDVDTFWTHKSFCPPDIPPPKR